MNKLAWLEITKPEQAGPEPEISSSCRPLMQTLKYFKYYTVIIMSEIASQFMENI